LAVLSSAFVVSARPLSVPLFLFYGLNKGAFIAKRFVLRLDPNVFRLLMDGIMVVAGLSLLWTAFS
jgi:uncharacterized membrane protein YfcA